MKTDQPQKKKNGGFKAPQNLFYPPKGGEFSSKEKEFPQRLCQMELKIIGKTYLP